MDPKNFETFVESLTPGELCRLVQVCEWRRRKLADGEVVLPAEMRLPRKIEAIKAVRLRTGLDLGSCKRIVDRYASCWV